MTTATRTYSREVPIISRATGQPASHIDSSVGSCERVSRHRLAKISRVEKRMYLGLDGAKQGALLGMILGPKTHIIVKI